MAQPPKPLFVIFGIHGGATCCHVDSDRLFIGSQMGRVGVYGVDTKVLEETAYVDDDHRRIQSIDTSASGNLFIHIRGHAILRLRRHPEPPLQHWEISGIFETDHVGFCNSLLLDARLLTVSSDEKRLPMLCWTSVSGESINDQAKKSIIIGDSAADVMPMCMTVRVRNSGDQGKNQVIIGMEDGRLAVFNEENCEIPPDRENDGFALEKMIKLGREPIFSVASCSKWCGAGCARAPIYLVNWEDEGQPPREVQYPPDSAGCSSITFSPNQKQLLAGFGNGTIRVFSCLRLSVLLALSTTHSASITSLIWRTPENGEIVIATSSDSTVSMWKLR